MSFGMMSWGIMSSLWNPNVGKCNLLAVAAVLAATSYPVWADSYSATQIRSVQTDDERQLDQIRDQEITQLKIVMGRRQSQNRHPEILLRLAELYTEKYRHFFLKENEVHQGLLKSGARPRYVDHSRSNGYLQASMNACLAILKSRVAFQKMDQVYYYLGYNAGELGRRKDALTYYKTLVQRYPQSPYAVEAYRSLAEGAFDNRKYQESVQWYEKAARQKNVPSYPRTLYKLAWSYFKVKRYADALESMKRVVLLSGQDSKYVGLREEALNDLVAFYSEAGRYKEARDYFNQVSGGVDLYVQSLKKLSSVYERAGRHAQAVYVNEELIRQYQDEKPELTFDVLARNVEIYRKVGDSQSEEKALKRLVEFFVKHGPGVRSNSEEAELAWNRTKKYLRSRATEVHKEAQKKNTASEYSRAADLYGLYARAFLQEDSSDSAQKELSEIRVYRADALIRAGRENESMAELERTLREKDGNPKYRREAGLSLLNIQIKKIDEALKKNQSVNSTLQDQFESVSEYFEDQFPEDAIVAELQYKRARLEAARATFPEDSQKAMLRLVEKYPHRTESVDAAHDLVFGYVKANETDKAVELSRQYLANAALMRADQKGELRRFLDSVLARKSFTDVQNLEASNDFEKAARGFDQLANGSKDSEVARKSLNNAAVNYEKAGLTDLALSRYESLLKSSRSKTEQENYRSSLKGLASKALWSSDFTKAAELYARFERNPSFSMNEQEDFANLAVQLHWGIGEKSKAAEVAHEVARRRCPLGAGGKKSSPFCRQIWSDLADIYLESNQYQQAVDALSKIKSAESTLKLAQVYKQIGDDRKTNLHLEEAARMSSKDRKEVNASAKAAFLLVEPRYQAFQALKLELPESVLKARTRDKLNLLESLVTRYENVVSYGDGEWGIAALERMGSLFLSFAQELRLAPAPPGLNEAQQSQYQRGIESIAQPLQTRGYEFLEKASKKGLSLQVLSPVYIRVSQALARRSPIQFPPAHYSLNDKSGYRLRLMGAVTNSGDWRQQIRDRLKANPRSVDTWIEFGNAESLGGRPRIARLLYEQALQLNPKSQAATNNRGVLAMTLGQSLEGAQFLIKAVELGEFAKEARLNLTKALLGYHHFPAASNHVKILRTRFVDDPEVQEVYAVSRLGNGDIQGLNGQWDLLGDALANLFGSSARKSFTYWYNKSVWACLKGDRDEKQDALDLLKDHQDEVKDSVEKEMIHLSLELFGKK